MNQFDLDDTIVAIASMAGPGLRGIVRISGNDCLSLIERTFSFDQRSYSSATSNVFHPSKKDSNFSRRSTKGNAWWIASVEVNSFDGDSLRLPGHLMIWPVRSYTGQPAAEFHTVAATPLLEMLLAQLCQSGARLAQPGEFTLRAFLSGRIDLPQAEAVLATIDAQSRQEFEVALKQMAGGLSGPVADAVEQLKSILAELEAGLDFVEEDIEFINAAEIERRLTEIQNSLANTIHQIDSRYQRDANLRAVLIGLPNSGKSSLFNALLGRQKAIVSSESGTTTDYLAGRLDFTEFSIELVDTAGVEFGDPAAKLDLPESIADLAQLQRQKMKQQAGLTLLCCSLDADTSDWEMEQIKLLVNDTLLRAKSLLIFTRADLAAPHPDVRLSTTAEILHFKLRKSQSLAEEAGSVFSGDDIIITSMHDPASVERLHQKIKSRSRQLFDAETDLVGSTVARTGESLRQSSQRIAAALAAVDQGWGEEIVAAEIRLALDELGLVVGTVYNDDILDLVFSRFCIGK